MRGVTKQLLAAALALLLAAGFAACGGDDSDGSTAASTAATTEQTAPPAAPDDSGSPEKEKKEPGDDRGGSSAESDDPGSGPEDSGSGPEDSGSGSDSRSGSGSSGSDDSERSAGFRTPGGDNSIQNYGEEADDAEREAASALVVGFLRARAAGNWARVCADMASVALKPIEDFTARSPQFNGKSCPELLRALTGNAPASARTSHIGDGIDSLRVEGERAFALFHGTDGKDYFIPLIEEDGEWKVGALDSTPFPG